MNQIRSYPSVMQIGHRMIADIFKSQVLVEEKVDGSQLSFGLIGGELLVRSKGKQQLIDAPDKMFGVAVEMIKTLDLHPEWTYRGEYLKVPKHNVLAYSRVPQKNIILFDVDSGIEDYLSPAEKSMEATRLGLEFVPVLFGGVVENFEMFKDFLDRESVLGGCKIEGVVVKNYSLFTLEKKVAMGKYVSEAFKEVHAGEWKKSNPNSKDLETLLIEQYSSIPRWQKAVQHLRESGVLEESAKDIGPLMREVPNDILKEHGEEIKEKLFKHFWPKISRGVTRGLPEWWKEELAKTAFEDGG